ncbi:MAG: hypothetical protein VCA36_02640 [Opitutales bacterium]
MFFVEIHRGRTPLSGSPSLALPMLLVLLSSSVLLFVAAALAIVLGTLFIAFAAFAAFA